MRRGILVRLLIWHLSIFFLSTWTTQAYSEQAFVLGENHRGELLGRFMTLLEDPGRSLSINDFLLNEQPTRFRPNAIAKPNLGFSKSVHWARFQIDNKSTYSREIFLNYQYPLTDFLEIFQVNSSGVTLKKSGDKEFAPSALIPYFSPVSSWQITPGVNTFYVRIQTNGLVQFPVSVWTRDQFYQTKMIEFLATGSMYGLIVSMLFYNLVLFASFRQKLYLVYVTFLALNLLSIGNLQGVFQPLLSPSLLRWMSNEIYLSAASGATAFGGLFGIMFLDLKSKQRALYWVLLSLSGVCFVLVPLSFISYDLTGSLLLLASLVMNVALLVSGGVMCLRKFRPAYFFTLAWTTLFIGNALFNLSLQGILKETFLSSWFIPIGQALEVILLSLAIGDKMDYLQKKADAEILSLNARLERHIKNIEIIVDEKTRNIKLIMKHIHQGIFTVSGNELKIGPDYSEYLRAMLADSDISERKLSDLILSKSDLSDDVKNQLESILRFSLGENILAFELNADNLVREMEFVDTKGSRRILEIDWAPVMDKKQIIESILVTVKDVSEIRRLQFASQVKDRELQIISEIINIPQANFQKFIESCRQYVSENRRLILSNPGLNRDALKILFINLHTMKGTARSLLLKEMATTFHHIEQYYAGLQRGTEVWDQERLLSELNQAEHQIDLYESINNEKLGRGNVSPYFLDEKIVKHQIELLHKLDFSLLDVDAKNILEETQQVFHRLFYSSSVDFFDHIFVHLERLAKDLEKEMPIISIVDPGINLSRDAQDILQKVFVHIIRNSMDHGIESARDRIMNGKNPRALIRMSLLEKDNNLIINYCDDGRGLPLGALKKISVERGILQANENDDVRIAEAIFESGLSTAERISDISGRGVGMGAVRRLLEEAGGSIEICFPEPGNENTIAYRAFEFNIKLPGKYFRLIRQNEHHAA
ncbi:MAG TPA: 7TM diverse intracellular signaling domain-containing protein [Oligoflexus sp.]|uniref:7TM diverse intracellular signaling domain-containing protein n=1 Tax=Oligoflexus sp. TaxID=1971216 RepID=UPI002D2757EB|nr:7TM diverse intracellular signaling domain-containing protein [Oligoflexus sp.]HYX36628.1 7TM diverse intracellular signaling domain-containing protein [Oligoflexus sp.]